MTTTNPERMLDYLLIGGGLAAATAAEEIRKRDAQGSILIVTNDTYLPYHRPPLSRSIYAAKLGGRVRPASRLV